MGLTKQYLAYRAAGHFNIIASARPNINFITYNATDGRYVAVGAAENVIIWDLRLGQKVLELSNEKIEVTALRASPDKLHIAVGHVDGTVEIFNLKSRQSVFSLALHRSAVSVLRYDSLGLKLASGSNDTDVVIIDVVSQQGKHRLTGHTGAITDLCFYEKMVNVIVTSSKDTQVKFWDIETQFCFKTLVDNRTEVWGLTFMRNFDYLVTGSRDAVLNVYKIRENDKMEQQPINSNIEFESETMSPVKCDLAGTIQRGGKGRTVSLVSDANREILGCFGTNNVIELFSFVTEKESLERLSKRMKKLKVDTEGKELEKELSLSDEIRRHASIKTNDKIKSFDILLGLDSEIRVTVVLANNTVQLFSLKMAKKEEAKLLRTITQPGHNSEVRSVCFSSDSLAIASGSGNSLKIWNRPTLNCVRTIETGYILSACFVPGDRHVLLGLKTGNLLIVDIVTGTILEDIPAHKDELWSICILPDLRGCATGGGDATVKIWSFELIEDSASGESKQKVLSLLHRNTLELEENVLAVKISPNSKYIAVALLDSTVKIFFLDSFKFFLSLYGHKLPVLCMDISYDNSLLVTGSADRNVKIWGMDFGDCHRSLFAHDDSVMSIQFIPKTHMFFTCGKDGKIKQWDADNFQKILNISAHIGEAHGLAISPSGFNLATCGSDRMIRIFERTDEIIVLEDAQEEERADIENKTLATGEETELPGLPGLKMPSRKTIGAEKSAESILECLEQLKEYETGIENNDLKNLMLAYGVLTPMEYLLSVLSRIRSSDLEEALLILPFSIVVELLDKLLVLLDAHKDQTELLTKIIFFLFRIHQKPIVHNKMMLPTIQQLIEKLNTLLTDYRDMIGTNLYGLQYLQRDIEIKQGVELFADAAKAKKLKERKQKTRTAKRAHIQMAS